MFDDSTPHLGCRGFSKFWKILKNFKNCTFFPKFDFDDFWVDDAVFRYAEHNCAGQRAFGPFFEALGPFARFLEGKIKSKEKIIFKTIPRSFEHFFTHRMISQKDNNTEGRVKKWRNIEKMSEQITCWALKCHRMG